MDEFWSNRTIDLGQQQNNSNNNMKQLQQPLQTIMKEIKLNQIEKAAKKNTKYNSKNQILPKKKKSK